jgi:hypothetical protein
MSRRTFQLDVDLTLMGLLRRLNGVMFDENKPDDAHNKMHTIKRK